MTINYLKRQKQLCCRLCPYCPCCPPYKISVAVRRYGHFMYMDNADNMDTLL